jgi:hypothetical protein
MSESTTFAEAATAELHRRGVATAGRVGVVVDGAEWIQGFIDLHAPEAVRILDFPHAAESVTAIGQAEGTDGVLLSSQEVAQQVHALNHEGPEQVLACLRALVEAQPEAEQLGKRLAYLDKRVGQMQYPRFREQGWPIGSGSGESANKLVVEERLKGPGMHWAVENVNPMLALRNAVCNDRWAEVWKQIEDEQRRQVRVRRDERHRQRRPQLAGCAPGRATPPEVAEGVLSPQVSSPAPAKPASDGKPAAGHPWRKAWSRRRQCEEARTA